MSHVDRRDSWITHCIAAFRKSPHIILSSRVCCRHPSFDGWRASGQLWYCPPHGGDWGDIMPTRVTANRRDLRALAAIVRADRPDVPADEGLPPSLLRDLMDQVRCDVVAFAGFDSGRQLMWFSQTIRGPGVDAVMDRCPVHWEHYWNCELCSYPDRTGDLRSIIKTGDFYSIRQWHAIGRCGIYQSLGFDHALMLTLPASPGDAAGPGRTLRLFFLRGPGADFSERDRAQLTLLRPHLHEAYLDAEGHRHPVPRLTARQQDLLRLVAEGNTNSQIARRLSITEGTVRTHLENIYRKLDVSNRAAAITRASRDLGWRPRMGQPAYPTVPLSDPAHVLDDELA